MHRSGYLSPIYTPYIELPSTGIISMHDTYYNMHIVRVSTSNMTFKMACRDYRATLSPLSFAVPSPLSCHAPAGVMHINMQRTRRSTWALSREIYLSLCILVAIWFIIPVSLFALNRLEFQHLIRYVRYSCAHII